MNPACKDRMLTKQPLRFLKYVNHYRAKFSGKVLKSINHIKILLREIIPKKKRQINKKSKKIVYIGHSYHAKTKSTAFLLDYLREFYDVEVVLDESWRKNGKSFPDLSFIDNNYLCVFFFQNLPDKSIIDGINNDNLIFAPMYDSGVHKNHSYLRFLKKFKFLCFSRTLHAKLQQWGLESLYVQYFPKPSLFFRGKLDEVFFWQRTTKKNINVIDDILENSRLKIHIHRAIDPNHQFLQPTPEQEKKFDITYSDWFSSREEMLSVLETKSIYIAPREYEGIGLSFLEAMAMGKAVIAEDNPTMNEYIQHGKTGYLFDNNKIKKIELSNIAKVQEQTYAYMCDGYQKWLKNREKIISLIEKE